MGNKIGVLIVARPETDFDAEFAKVKKVGATCCQITVWNMALYTEDNAKRILEASKKYGIEISTLWCGWSGPTAWNFTDGQEVLGLISPTYRYQRLQDLQKGVDFAERLGVSRIATHIGFMPENPFDANYHAILSALRYLCKYCKSKNIDFLFETGQETPVTLLRAIEDIGMDNVGINFDTANLILYGKANSADAVLVFGKYVKDTHIKDGFYPTNGMELGKEAKVGEGLANLPLVIQRLNDCGYEGNYIIEREISGEQQQKDIADTVLFLEKLLNK